MTTRISTYDPTLFQGAAGYYAQYRSRYPQALFDLLADIFKLDGKGRLLDLGCGAGLVAIPFSNRFEAVVAVDPDTDMLEAAQAEATQAQITNIRWIHDRAESIDSKLGQFRLVTMGRSFHWMQRDQVLDKLYPLLSEDGGVAILKTSDDPWNSQLPWKQTAITVVKRWLGDQRRTGKSGQGLWQPLEVSHDEVVAQSQFSRQATYEVKFEQSWTIDSYLGYLYSTAFALPSFFGENRERFEADLRESLLAVVPSGQFSEELTSSALVAWKN